MQCETDDARLGQGRFHSSHANAASGGRLENGSSRQIFTLDNDHCCNGIAEEDEDMTVSSPVVNWRDPQPTEVQEHVRLVSVVRLQVGLLSAMATATEQREAQTAAVLEARPRPVSLCIIKQGYYKTFTQDYNFS